MTGRRSTARTVGAVALLISAAPLVVACTIKSAGHGPQGPEPTQGPFATVGTQTVPAAP
jgi:hypothetical protein